MNPFFKPTYNLFIYLQDLIVAIVGTLPYHKGAIAVFL